MHQEWTDLMSGYLDGELEPVTRRRLEAHLADCSACAAVLADLRRIVAAAPGYVGSPPDPDPWDRIAAGIAERRVVELPGRRKGVTLRLRELAAAAVLAAGLGAGGAWFWLAERDAGPAPTTPSVEGPALAVSRKVGLTSAGYDSAVAELESTLEANRGRLDTSTVRILEQSLRSIDQAIAEARLAIQRDSTKGYLNEQIAANMRKKLNVLKLATRAIASET